MEGNEESGWKPGTPAAVGRSEIALMGPPAVSPDGRWVAYSSGDALVTDVWVEPFDLAGGRWQVAERAIAPRWSPANRSLFYRSVTDGQIMVADYDVDGGSFRPLKARRVGAINAGPNSSYAVHPDGKRLAVTLPAGTEPSANDRVVFVSNFFDELRRLFAER
jgi:Tol biopolymer transport system component